MDSSSHWVEKLFPARYSIKDYRSTFEEKDETRLRRYIKTLSTFDGPTLAAVYEQSYLFSLIHRMAKDEEELGNGSKVKNQNCQTEPVDSILDIRLIRAFLEKHKDKLDREQSNSDELWSSDEISTIRSVYAKTRDECLRLKSENEFLRQELTKLEEKLDEATKSLEEIQQEHASLKKTHGRWTLRTTSAEQSLNEHRKENEAMREHLRLVNEQNQNFRREQIELKRVLAEKEIQIEQMEKKIDFYDEKLRSDFDRRIDLMEKRVQVDKDRSQIEKFQLRSELDKEQNLRKQNLLALDQLRKHFATAQPNENEESTCDIKNVKYV